MGGWIGSRIKRIFGWLFLGEIVVLYSCARCGVFCLGFCSGICKRSYNSVICCFSFWGVINFNWIIRRSNGSNLSKLVFVEIFLKNGNKGGMGSYVVWECLGKGSVVLFIFLVLRVSLYV